MSNKTAKTTTTISSIDEAKEEDEAKIAPTHSVLPLLEPPSEFEAKYYYYTFGSHPRLVGRTSSGTTPWWRLVKNDEETKVLEIEAARWGPATGLDTATSYGRVDKHPFTSAGNQRCCSASGMLSGSSISRPLTCFA